MADSHLQINADASTTDRKTSLWPSSKVEQQEVIKSIFNRDNWSVTSIENISGSHWRVITQCLDEELKLELYISSIRDEARQPDEFKMQLGNTYPEEDTPGWITVVLGIYTINDGSHPVEYILSGYDSKGFTFSTNPSIRGTRTSGLQQAKIYGFYKAPKNYLFRPEFIYYYIKNLDILNNQESTHPSPSFEPINSSIDVESMKNFITALKTKPFLLLAGISGTGKSQKVKELAYMTCPDRDGLRDDATTPGNYCIIEVKPNWHDSTELLGYYSNLSGKYDITPFIHFAYKAIQHPDVPFFVCLDEMNLAPVEQYFAEYLSVLETRTKQADGKIVTAELLKKEIFDRCELTKGEEHLYKTVEEEEIITYLKNNGLRLPENLFVIGTVNMDDTTHQFSRKVIDRAFTIEMNGEDLTSMFSDESVKALCYADSPLGLDTLKPEFVKANEVLNDTRFAQYSADIQIKVPSILNDINTVLKNTPFRVSYRVQNEFILYMSSVILAGMEDVNAAVKNTALVILLEKILPRVQGDNKLLATAGNSNVLKDLRNLVEEKLSGEDVASDVHDEVIAKLDEMNLKLENSYFANFF